MTVFFINGKPHVAAHNSFLELSQYDYLTLLEHGEITQVQEVECVD